jgi:S-adenosylmethionine:tRNA ribosyltransferase-isomerase
VNVADFDYELPPERIAQEPAAERDGSKLFTLDRATGEIGHRGFVELPDLARPGDLFVFNDTRVLRARLEGRKETGGRVELLLLEPEGDDRDTWRCLVRASKPVRAGTRIGLAGGAAVEVLGREDDAWTVRIHAEGGTDAVLEREGRTPLPPYIKRRRDDPRERLDRERYQTVFARSPGAVAAPTAGLHFTPRVLAALAAREVRTTCLTLHTGEGTFLPVRAERVEENRMHAERFEISERAAESVRAARLRGGRVVAVGTTVVRALEANATEGGSVRAGSGRCDLFIRPGHRFRVTDALVTNFHLPRSTLLMLVSAFGGTERVLAAYREAVRTGYRFYSYGDVMWIA